VNREGIWKETDPARWVGSGIQEVQKNLESLLTAGETAKTTSLLRNRNKLLLLESLNAMPKGYAAQA
jgi:hypothetical protein